MKLNVENNKGKNDILVSVIVPVYNAEKYLKTCLDSLINQTYKNLEIICVNDGSNDHSLDILKFYEKKDRRVKVITQKNAGPAAARNVALQHVKGDYISFVDADDYLEKNAYEILSEVAIEKEHWDIIMFGGNVVGENNEYVANKLTTSFRSYIDCNGCDVVFKEKVSRPFLWLHFIKKSLLQEPTIIKFDEALNLGEDQIFQFQYIPRAKNIIVLDLKLYNYRIEKNSSLMQLYSNRRVAKTNCHFRIVEKVIKDWKNEGYYDDNQDALWTWIVEFLYFTVWQFPAEFKKQYGMRILEMMDKYQVKEYLIDEREQNHLEEIKYWTIIDSSSEAELKNLIKKTEQEKYEIEETLKSRAFRLGRFLTKKSQRIELDITGRK